jgi:hypothetical protein
MWLVSLNIRHSPANCNLYYTKGGKMIHLEKRYRNYWLDLVRKEDEDREEENRKEKLRELAKAIQDLTIQRQNKP